jgi:hypothetical protein
VLEIKAAKTSRGRDPEEQKNYEPNTAAPSPNANQRGLNCQQQQRNHAKAKRQD